jgi:hypothetical protein
MVRIVLLALAMALGGLLAPFWAADQVDAGGHFDPNGVTTDAGGRFDPDGTTATGDAGNHADPDG